MFLHKIILAATSLLVCHQAAADPAIEPLMGFQVGLNSNGPALEAACAAILWQCFRVGGLEPRGPGDYAPSVGS